jgi:hypothetical protein
MILARRAPMTPRHLRIAQNTGKKFGPSRGRNSPQRTGSHDRVAQKRLPHGVRVSAA